MPASPACSAKPAEGRALSQMKTPDGFARMLIEVDGFVAGDDPRLAVLSAADPALIVDVVVIGAYPVPVPESQA